MVNSSGYSSASRRWDRRRNLLRERYQPDKFEVRNLVRVPGNSIGGKENLICQTRNMPTA